MTTLTKTRIATIILNTEKARQWVDENICVERNQWTKDDDTGCIAFRLDRVFLDELLDEMTDDLTQDIDFTVR